MLRLAAVAFLLYHFPIRAFSKVVMGKPFPLSPFPIFYHNTPFATNPGFRGWVLLPWAAYGVPHQQFSCTLYNLTTAKRPAVANLSASVLACISSAVSVACTQKRTDSETQHIIVCYSLVPQLDAHQHLV